MGQSRAASLSLVGGILALDFANTVGGRNSEHHVDHLRAAAHVIDWASHAGSLDPKAAKRARAMVADEEAGRRLLGQALKLRDTIYRVGSAVARGEVPVPTELDALKTFAGKTMAAAELARTADGGYGLDFSRAPCEVAVLGPVVWSAIDLLEAGDLDRVKQCPALDCGWLFFDRSKNNSRQWCDMAVCGNRAKVRKHREGQAR